ncbi:MAG: hypothetical protein COA42_08385 [Alteromonadaceae bacterium]|nr:MAG: hypothetical protein COA42_08385 [Alteromonadaceae bacterium]
MFYIFSMDYLKLVMVSVQITRGNTRYRNERQVMTVVTRKKGEAALQWQGAGMYVLEAQVERSIEGAAHSKQLNTLYVTLAMFAE